MNSNINNGMVENYLWLNRHQIQILSSFGLWPHWVIWLNGHWAQSLGSFGLNMWPPWVRVQWLGWFALLFSKVDINPKQDDSKGDRFVVAQMSTSGFPYALGVVNTFLVRLWRFALMNFLRNIATSLKKMNWTYRIIAVSRPTHEVTCWEPATILESSLDENRYMRT